MYCEHCGKKNEDGRTYCYSCGSPLSSAEKNGKNKSVNRNPAEAASGLAGAGRNPSYYAQKKVSASQELKEEQKKLRENEAGTEKGKRTERLQRPKTEKKQAEASAAEKRTVRRPAAERKTEEASAAEKRAVRRSAAERKTEEASAAEKRAAGRPAAERKTEEASAAEKKAVRRSAAAGKTENLSAAKKQPETAAEKQLEAMEKELHQLNRSRTPAAALIAALLVMAAILAVLITQVPVLYGAKKEAAGFETAMLSGKWEEAYEYLLLEGETSAFLSRETFTEVMTRTGASGFRDLELEEVSSTGDEKVFAASYAAAEGNKTEYVTMHRTGKRKLLFLNEWKVDPVTVTAANVRISVPAEASLLLCGQTPESEGTVKAEEHAVEYTFDRLFTGSWQAELTAENRAPYYTDVQVEKESENGEISLASAELYPDQEMMDSVLKQFTQDYQSILNASINREEFSAVEQYFAEEAVQEGRAQNMYANACSQAFDPETGSGILQYELSDISAKFVPVVKSGYAKTGDLVMEIHSTMTYSYLDAGVEKTDTQTSVGLLCYHQENGKWKIQSFS